MSRPTAQLIWGILMITRWLQGITAYRVNTTIYDINLARVTYSDVSIKCERWVNVWLLWRLCDSSLKPWTSGVYHSQGKIATFHSSLNNRLASATIDFQGTDVWVYGPPSSQLAKFPPDYKICLYESYQLSSKSQCYQINTTEAYSTSEDKDKPVVVFARGQLLDSQHRIVISVADPADDLQAYNGIKFSHVIYTTERPTPWPVEEDHWRYREVVIHDTHPLLSYSPKPSKWLFWETSPWSAKTRTAVDGTTISWHEVQSHDEEDRDQWGISTKIQAGAVAIYGAPSVYVEKRDNLGPVCVQLDSGPCEILDLKTIYSNQGELVQHESVLLWRNNALDPSRETRVFIRLVKAPAGTEIVFPFKSINFFEEQEYSSPGALVGNPQNATFGHDHWKIDYHPRSFCEDPPVCKSFVYPWNLKTIGPAGSELTYRTTISKHRVLGDPHVTLALPGATAVYLYGAPNAYAVRPFAPQHICINDACRVIDVEQAYLHPPWPDMESTSINEPQGRNATVHDATTSSSIPHPELEPVLIWSMTGLNYGIAHTLQLALASLPSPDTAEMSFVKFVITKVATDPGEYPPNSPAPGPDHAYAGPLYPPHATEWVPMNHKLPPAISIETPPTDPELTTPASYAITLLVAYICLRLVFCCCSCETRETQPLLPTPSPPRPPPRNPSTSDRPPDYSSVVLGRPNGRR